MWPEAVYTFTHLQQSQTVKMGRADIPESGGASGVINVHIGITVYVPVYISHMYKCFQVITYNCMSFLLLGSLTTFHLLRHAHIFLPQSMSDYS